MNGYWCWTHIKTKEKWWHKKRWIRTPLMLVETDGELADVLRAAYAKNPIEFSYTAGDYPYGKLL